METDTTDWAGNIEELTGFTSDELKSMKLKFWLSLIHPEDLNRYLENFEKHMESGEAYRMEYRFRKKNEEYIYRRRQRDLSARRKMAKCIEFLG